MKIETPAYFNKRQADKWALITGQLNEYGLLSRLDSDIITVYVENWEDWLTATEAIRKDGQVIEGHRGNPRQHPAYPIARDCAERLRKLADVMGLTPSSRRRMGVQEPEEVPDDIARLLSFQ
ncbi:phage terminase small subunit P27 family [Streptomyces sp. NPDC005525]|uniref:phage terminase small subunit P27 family n=1 Tax=Streptomyces sp. NPDC005525 TaxID=3364720 RepID=UPI0036D075EF